MSQDGVMGALVGFRSVQTRSVMVLLVDVPAAEGDAAMDYLGTPLPGQSVNVALLRMGEDGPEGEPVHGTYEKVQTVADRRAIALTVEVPLELGHRALKRLGTPGPGKVIKVFLALLTGIPVQPPPKERDRASKAIQRLVMRCKDAPFQKWRLNDRFIEGDADGNELDTKNDVLEELGITSRTQLREPDVLAMWEAMERTYERHLQGGPAAAIQD